MSRKHGSEAEKLRVDVEELRRDAEERKRILSASYIPKPIDWQALKQLWPDYELGMRIPRGTKLRGQPFHPFPFQQRALTSFFDSTNTALWWSRQTGKTTLMGGFVPFLALNVPGSYVLVSSFKQSTSDEIVDLAWGWSKFHVNAEIQGNLPRMFARDHIYFNNGSKLISVPYDEGALGKSVDFLYLDECQSLPDEILDYCLPTQSAESVQGRKVWAGTIASAGGFWFDIVSDAGKYDFNMLKIVYLDALSPTDGPINQRAVERDRTLFGDSYFRRNYLLEPVAGMNRLVEPALVTKAMMPEPITEFPYPALKVVGIDHAISRDRSVGFCGAFAYPHLFEWKVHCLPRGMSFKHQIEHFLAVFGKDAFYIVDSTAESGKEFLMQFQNVGLDNPCWPFDYSKSEAKAHLMNGMLDFFMNGYLHIYDEILKMQLLNFRFHLSDSGNEIFGEPNIADDYVNALALCVERCKQLGAYDPAENTGDSAVMWGEGFSLPHSSSSVFDFTGRPPSY